MSFKVFQQFNNQTIKGAALKSLAQGVAGSNEFGQLLFTGAAVDGDNFVLQQGSWVGRTRYESNTDVVAGYARKFWIKLLAASALTLADASLNNTNAGIIRGVGIVGHGMVPGSVFGVGTEFFRVLRVADVNTVDVRRGYAGSTVAVHAATAAVLTFANYTGIALGVDVIVPVTALAIATAGPQIATAMNDLDGFNPKDFGDIGQGVIKQASLGFGFVWEYIATGTRLLFSRAKRVVAGSATTVTVVETIANATAVQLQGGTEVAEVFSTVESRVPSAADVTAGYLDFVFPFPVKAVTVKIVTTATRVPLVWDGAISYSADFKRVTIDNSGAVDWAATHTVTLAVTG